MNKIECCICYNTLKGKNSCTTECGHRFCLSCIIKASKRSNNCPYCRTPMIYTEEEEIDHEYNYEIEFEGDEEEEEENQRQLSDHIHYCPFIYKYEDQLHFPVTIHSIKELTTTLEKNAVYGINEYTTLYILKLHNEGFYKSHKFEPGDFESEESKKRFEYNNILNHCVMIFNRTNLLEKHFESVNKCSK